MGLGAQRRPAPRVHHPLLVRHLGFWHHKLEAGADEDEITKARRRWLNSVNLYSARLYNALGGQRPGTATIPGVSNLKTPHRTGKVWAINDDLVTYEFDWHCLHVTIRIELHTEYFTLTSFLDASVLDPKVNRSTQINDGPKELKSFHQGLVKLYKLLELPGPRPDNFRDQFTPIAESFFFDTWELYAKEVLHPAGVDLNSLGDEFADFRGVVIGEEAENARPVAKSILTPIKLQRSFWRNLTKPHPSVPHVALEDIEWDLRCEAMWPFVTAKVRSRDLRDYEYSVSTLLDGRALYISALGAQPIFGKAADALPLFYWLYTDRLGGWAIGRLLETINHQGTLRLAALAGFDDLRKASDKIREAEAAIKRAFAWRANRDLAGASEQSNESSAIAGDFADRTSCLDDAQKFLAEADQLVAGGVEYRIERARYYIGRFYLGLEGLRIKAISDYQPYNIFVQSKLGAAFGYIDLLWSRYERVRRDARSLYEQNLAEATSIGNSDIEKIQGVADFALFLALLPYYLGTLLAHALPWRKDTMEESGSAPAAFWWLMILWGMIAALSRVELRDTTWRSARRLALWILGFGAGYYLKATLADLFTWPYPDHQTPLAMWIVLLIPNMLAAILVDARPSRLRLAGKIIAALAFCVATLDISWGNLVAASNVLREDVRVVMVSPKPTPSPNPKHVFSGAIPNHALRSSGAGSPGTRLSPKQP